MPISKINEDNFEKDEYVTQRASGAHIAAVFRPYISYGLSAASHVIIPEKSSEMYQQDYRKMPLNSGHWIKFCSYGKMISSNCRLCGSRFRQQLVYFITAGIHNYGRGWQRLLSYGYRF